MQSDSLVSTSDVGATSAAVDNYDSLEWQERRSAFSHDFLKNTYLNRLSAAIVRLRQRPDSPLVLDYLRVDFPLWAEQHTEIEWIVTHLTESLSPARLFDRGPLSNLDAESVRALRQISHDVWLVRHSIPDLVSRLRTCVSDVDAAFEAIRSSRLDAVDLGRRADLLPALERLEQCCRSLSDMMRDVRLYIGQV
jgi:hypothetical protein